MQRAALVAFLLASVTLAPACGSKDKTEGVARPTRTTNSLADVSVDSTFPSDDAKTNTNSIHVWVLTGTTCSDLVGGKTDPYDATLDRKGDAVSQGSGKGTAKGVEVGKAIVYVEAVDFGGDVQWAGCKEVTVGAPSTSVNITLGKARVYDCSLATVKDGAPCDDGKLCTVGDNCKGGECQAGGPKDCTGVTDGCNVGTCDEATGACVTKVADDGTACDDNLFCTSGDVCKGGKCAGALRDCSKEANPCYTTSNLCDEANKRCTPLAYNFGAPCDDGKFCTDRDTCNSSGQCTGTPRDCGNRGCGTGSCNEAQKTCDITSVLPVGSSCSDGLYCTNADQCDGLGHCVGTPTVCTTSSTSTCQTATCDETNFGCRTIQKLSGSPCDDGSPCTTADHCDSFGTCSGTLALSGTPCDDGNPCTLVDECDSYGACSLTLSYALSGTVCTVPCITNGYCDTYGDCLGTNATAGTTCNDRNACTTGDVCSSFGTCKGTPAATCPAAL